MLPLGDPALHRMNRLVFHLRWLLLALAGVLVALRGGSLVWPLGLLIASILYNLGLGLLEFADIQPPYLPAVVLLIDGALALGLYLAAGGPSGPLVWVGLLPALALALTQGSERALAAAVLFSALQAALALLLLPGNYAALAPVGLSALAIWPFTAGVGWLTRGMRATLRAEARQHRDRLERQNDLLRAHARAIAEMSTMVSATQSYTRMLQAGLNYGLLVEEEPQASESLAGAVLTFEDDLLRVAHAWRLPDPDLRVICAAREGVLGAVLRTGEASLIVGPDQDPELKHFQAFRACQALMALPLRAGYDTYGVMLYGHTRADFFDDDTRAFLQAVVSQVVIALQNAQLYKRLRQEKERLLEVQEEAQKKLARDLHDGPTQLVAALAMRANFARRVLERDPQAAGEEIAKMEELARHATKEIRHMLFTLRPLALESQGLTAALQQLAEKVHDTHGQNILIEAEPGADGRLEKNQQGVLFYIAEEAVSNARKHAQAEHVWVRLKIQRETLVLEVQDDGVGFNVGAVDANYEKRGSLGMVNMRERAEMLNGVVRVDSAEGRGTRISVLVPLNQTAGDRP